MQHWNPSCRRPTSDNFNYHRIALIKRLIKLLEDIHVIELALMKLTVIEF